PCFLSPCPPLGFVRQLMNRIGCSRASEQAEPLVLLVFSLPCIAAHYCRKFCSVLLELIQEKNLLSGCL
ncbi:hypothetical protein PIB30_094702, partial [Stylosanthes scabra]|nr:hypothetical protein [Stylosanthes scabra]